MGTALFEMVTHGFICVNGRAGSICPSGGESDKNYCILCGRQWGDEMHPLVCLVIKSQLHKVMLCDDWRRTGTKKRFTLVHKAEKDIYTIILN